MLDNDLTPYSALDIFVKDMVYMYPSRFHGIRGFTQFLGHCHIYCKSSWVPLPLASAAEQLYLSASSQGFGRQDDSGVVRVYTLRHRQ